ncbi:hypothetical protein ACFFJY_17600 [Fictibacillus aquaticus]|uniref:Uncharacterized protein n=1 Tax=Fictibacillus aquaticus TaxID=2021314 RepID=A0A235F5X0_9BACL|nr:hypothetical protein [Fictibacillus aquaticus]OYD56639.1 hypothetical protein CGZ90_16650 [Fictibacillus aquaticus]
MIALIFAIVCSIILFNPHIKWWIKTGAGVYYAVLTYFFNTGRQEIEDKYHYKGPIEVYWDKNSDYVDAYYGFFTIPFMVLLIYSYYLWLKHCKTKTQKFWIVLSIIPVGLLFLWLSILLGMLGYRP